MSAVRNVAVLGATGSIGSSTLDVIARHPDRFRAYAVTAHSRTDALVEICRTHRPAVAVSTGPADHAALAAALRAASPGTTLLLGAAALEQVAADPAVDAVMAAIVGAAGLGSSLAAARAGKRVLLANKEALVMAGGLFMAAVRDHGATLLPIDSEHNAIFQCLPANFVASGATATTLDRAGVLRVLLTGSGGPFRTRPVADLEHVTPDEACAHPTWNMGRKISIDSATMMNKALEIIEAHWLFDAPAERIEVVVHPQSVIHSMVEYADGSVLAQLGNPDMRTPIAQALAYPDRIAAGVSRLDLAAIARLSFEAPDPVRFPALRLAYEVLAAGGGTSAVFNASNEVAVAAFLAGRVSFPTITRVIEATLEALAGAPVSDLGAVLEIDRRARSHAEALISRHRPA
jgi:1-deoxy-D-xylulose-5-phosphate reductoisomerase